MKRLLIWITLLTVLFGSAIPIISALGRTAPPPEFAKWFTYPDGSPCPMPCLFGIRPGVTKFDDVDLLYIQSHPLLRDLKPSDQTSAYPESVQKLFTYRNSTTKNPGFILERDREGFVGSIELNSFYNASFPYIGDVWARLGTPQCAWLLTADNIITRYGLLGYLETRITVVIDDPNQNRYLNFADRVVTIRAESRMFSQELFGAYFSKWRGIDKEAYVDVNTHGCLP